jgi:solute carrier family 39 (zinc transporter), member 1/2/3
MSLEIWLFAFAVFSLSLMICILPKVVTRIGTIRRIYPFITLFSAGFLLGVQLLDLTPHMFEMSSHKHAHDGHRHEHPREMMLGFFVTGLSFLFLVAIDTFVLKHMHCDAENEHGAGHHHHSHEDEPAHSHSKTIPKDPVYGQVKGGALPPASEQLGCCNTELIKSTKSKTQALIYILGISIHSFFEGLALNPTGGIGSLEMGLLLHKVLESFALGVPLFASGYNFKGNLSLALVYSSLTPLGIVLGGITDGFSEMTLMKCVFQGLALGSIMFMVGVEMIPPCLTRTKGNPFLKMSVLVGGYVTSAAVIKLTDHH